jgi:hypothetical protein
MKKSDDIPKLNPFKVPEGYFDELPGRIMEVVSGTEPDQEKKTLIRRLRPYLAVAATVAALAVISYTAIHLSSGDGTRNRVEVDISATELTDSYLNDIDLLTLEEKVAESVPADRMPDVNSNEIIDYLITENIDIYDIYEQL